MGVLHETSRKVIASDMAGKTVRATKHDAVNVLHITFTDGSFAELWAECDSHGVPVIELDPKAKANEL